MKITYVRFRDAMPRPRSASRAYGNAKELTLADCPGGFTAGAHGVSYAHPLHGRVMVPWPGVVCCRVEDVAPEAGASGLGTMAPADAVVAPRKRGRPPKPKA